MNRDTLERRQVWVYIAAITAGLILGSTAPAGAAALERVLWPALAILMYATFTQVPLARLPAAFRDTRFMAAALLGNFVVLPALVAVLLMLLPIDGPLRLGLVLVLVVPCTDWFITFTQQGGGDVRRAITITPVLLVTQMALLPLYLWLFMGPEFTSIASAPRMVAVFAVIIALPLALAYLTQRWSDRGEGRASVLRHIGWYPVPLLALVLFLIAASQVQAVRGTFHAMAEVLIACLIFLVGAVLCGILIGRAFRLPLTQARTLLFSMATRNSFVVLPFALALPEPGEVAATVIVLQSLVELLGMLALLWLIPRRLLRAA